MNLENKNGLKGHLLGASAMLAITAALPVQGISAQDADSIETELEEVIVTGSRIVRADVKANSPVQVLSEEELYSRSDVTLDTFLNSLPQVNPAGTTSSNNPGNGGQSNIDLRGLGANRNLVLVDGRRTMVSASNMTVDLNTIPLALIESLEVITGGAGAVYGADAVAGAVNIKLKRDFKGLDLRVNYQNALREWDAEEYQISGVLGGNFADDRGNAVFAFDYTDREQLIKSQRPFSATATSTTSFFPDGHYFESGNAPSQAAVDAVFAGYGVAAGEVPTNLGMIGFNPDGTLFSAGIFNSPIDVQNWTGPIDLSVNANYFPDFYSYNFDEVNLLVLPLERKSFSTKLHYDLTDDITAFVSASWTNYSSQTALAPTPFPTVTAQGPDGTNQSRVTTSLVEVGSTVANQLIIPVTNPFIPADFATLLASRTGDNPALVGSGADEPFLMRQRSLWGGLRSGSNDNTVLQYMAGFRGNLSENWRFEVYAMEGKTTIKTVNGGNIRTDRVQQLLEASDGGNSICAGGYNPFGRQPVSAACITYLTVDATVQTVLKQRIAQGYVAGDLFDAPAGPVSIVAGYEMRRFRYDFDPGSLSGPVSGFNTANVAAGTNKFNDLFFEAFVPLARDKSFAESIDLTLGYRLSRSSFNDIAKGIQSSTDSSSAFKAELSWDLGEDLPRLRGSYQRSVRAPNFGELFDGGGSAPQIWDPCSNSTNFRTSGGQAASDLCAGTGVGNPDLFVGLPGTQATILVAGNTNLKPESADTFTFGAIYQIPESRLITSIDYYNIKVSDAILTPSSNLVIADCYNYYGNNPDLDPNYGPCTQMFRAGGNIVFIPNWSDPNFAFPGINGGFIKTSGIDIAASYGMDLSGGEWGTLDFQLQLNHVLSYKVQEQDNLPVIQYADTVAYFGAGLGQSFPSWKGVLNTRWTMGDFSLDVRTRYINGMDNRLSVEFPGETYEGTGSAWYWDAAASYQVLDNATLRVGINNLFDRKPEMYAPNVQSGTDPSTYDVVGRRITMSMQVKF